MNVSLYEPYAFLFHSFDCDESELWRYGIYISYSLAAGSDGGMGKVIRDGEGNEGWKVSRRGTGEEGRRGRWKG